MSSESGYYRFIAGAVLVVLLLAYTVNENRVSRASASQLFQDSKSRNSTFSNVTKTSALRKKVSITSLSVVKSKVSVSKCVPLLTNGTWVTSGNKTASWKLPHDALNECGLSSTFMVPLQSTPAIIESSLAKKWVVFTGDSSTRMVFDYLIGRLVGNWTSWPSTKYDNHGPPHSKMALGEKTSSYEFWFQGTRLTFIWTSINITYDSFDRFDEIKLRTVGSPDIIFAQHGYWDKPRPANGDITTHTARAFIDYLDKWVNFKELSDVYPLAYPPNSATHKVWLTLFDSCGVNDDGVNRARQSNWTIFDRTTLTEPFKKGTPSQAHPMNEILEIELELILSVINIV